MPATTHDGGDRMVDLSHLFPKQNEDVHNTMLDGDRLHFGRDVLDLSWLVTPLLEKAQARHEC